MEAFQQRVVEEHADLGIKISRLRGFVEHNEAFAKLPADEQGRMREQVQHMQGYHEVLGRRIEAFN